MIRQRSAFALLLVFLGGCSPTAEPTYLTVEELQDPATCAECHAEHVREWSGSMHAYASSDPVFLAMNARGQRETNGELGDFCVRCHAPMALEVGATTDGLNLPSLPNHLQGVTCYFCHNVESVAGVHNNPLRLANDQTMRGGIRNPLPNRAHRSAYSRLMDGEASESSDMCGSCHDIVTPAGLHLERTYHEWKDSLFAQNTPSDQLSCAKCHMDGRNGLAADVPGVSLRRIHSHAMPGVDIALTPFPELEAQRAGVQTSLDTTLGAELCVTLAGNFWAEVRLDNVAAGHAWPSGATHDRRAWVELIAYAEEQIVFESGRVPDDEAIESIDDPNLWYFHDDTFGPNGETAHMFWDIADYVSHQIPAPAKRQDSAAHVTNTYRVPPNADRITMRVLIRPMGFEVIDDLIASGDLEPEIRDRIPTFSLGSTHLEWTLDQRNACVSVPVPAL